MTAPLERHRLDVSALVWGIAFLAVGGLALAAELDWIELSGRRVVGLSVLSVGLAGVVGMIAASLRSRPEPPA